MGATKDFSRFINIVDADNLSDEMVLRSAQNGDLEALEILMNRYKNFVKAKARSYFLVGADREDIVQEGMIGLFKAVRDYCDEKPSSFKVFAELCITRQMITAIKTATRQKHIPLNSYISLNKPVCEHDSDRTLMEMVSGQRITNPEELMISQEELVTIEDIIGEVLSKLEMKVLMLYINGRSYQEIAKDLGRSEKSIDNALQRVKRKLEKYLETKREQDGY
ncbi:RNA polymerase sporulation sigma factor SigH [Tindallia californiensis]|uniref:RNA polymerase, sigma 30 subunit, SigH n=1 Tax=Tindallia californiensis TaxID=159292 RepID=A0A1H3R8J3_9FIRM|nr:RNA polymerase sporulation sigma factor SigH [Tindallia californiensis]SDZ21926.1 RNA polymerase, sigma 30 subunit, SigH [Tindallia californiensis]